MRTTFFPVKTICLAVALTIGGVHSALAAEPQTGPLAVITSLTYPDDSVLKTRLPEVQIVKAEQMQKNVAGKVALGVLLFAFGGGTGFSSSSKDNMVGTPIEGIEDRANLQISDVTSFAARLQAATQAAMQSDTQWTGKTFKNPLTLAGGVVNLVYEGLTGDDASLYRLKADWVVYKRKESFTLFGSPLVKVDCSYQSATPLTQPAWAETNYAQVKLEMELILPLCEQKLLAALPDLLKD